MKNFQWIKTKNQGIGRATLPLSALGGNPSPCLVQLLELQSLAQGPFFHLQSQHLQISLSLLPHHITSSAKSSAISLLSTPILLFKAQLD